MIRIIIAISIIIRIIISITIAIRIIITVIICNYSDNIYYSIINIDTNKKWRSHVLRVLSNISFKGGGHLSLGCSQK
jgi:hypothetical protein